MSYSFFSNPESTILSGYLAPGDSFAIFTPIKEETRHFPSIKKIGVGAGIAVIETADAKDRGET